MRKLVYRKRKGVSLRVLVRFTGLFVAVSGIMLALYTFFPLFSYVVYIMPAYASQSFASPIPQNTIITQDSIKSLLENTANQLTHLGNANDTSWLPPTSVDQYKQVGVTEQLSNYYLSVPRLGIDDAYVSTTDNNVNLHLIHFPGTALPPNIGNATIFGHSTLPQWFDPKNPHAIFATALDLKIGDIMNVTIGSKVYTYKIMKMSIIPADDTSYLAQDTDGSYISIVTCTPPGTTWKRLIVKAKLETS
ncbi:MAG TPA: sortase [Candidatus Sulfotelmatobacter sp.]|jgi:sortase A|nr:sortase [Candidatus Sulfotelmatobacter sp.]